MQISEHDLVQKIVGELTILFQPLLELHKNQNSSWLTHLNASEYLNISAASLYKLTSQRKIPFSKRGKKNYYLREDLDKYIAAGMNKSVEEIVKQTSLEISKRYLT